MKRTEIAETTVSHSVLRCRRAARAALAACVIATLPATGCRTGKSSWNLFSRSEPSAEVLAGSGPTTTYPSPPSAHATPEAIASVAAGTSTAKPPTGSETPETGAANPYALAGKKSTAAPRDVPTGFPTGSVPPTVSTSLAANENAAPPAYALPGRTSKPAASGPSSANPTASDLAASANGYSGVPAASPTKPPAAQGLPSGYQLGKEPVADPQAALASSSPNVPATSSSAGSSFSMPPLNGSATPDAAATAQAAPPKTGGFALPSDMPLPATETVAAATPAAPPAEPASKAGMSAPPESAPAANATAVAALGLPPAKSTPVNDAAPTESFPGGTADSPEYKTAAATKSAPATEKSAASGESSPNASGIQPAGYMPGSTGQSSAYPLMR
ncbi:hypothetical protein [Allorhodopirellula solitaria]|uniref:Uncharacterized protein n=1 Tax=Allorhodopirellula solitaria TaxID=2527987 RepID=A0A5C5YJ61_9BACT|nr:hypothetical protein [Allorhodopirellula solitaria]TWT74901.1 hypothetical protein CA85_01890 [Allorhodopirellula solitaria]